MPTRASSTSRGSLAVHTRSMSPMVSSKRRMLPATTRRVTPRTGRAQRGHHPLGDGQGASDGHPLVPRVGASYVAQDVVGRLLAHPRELFEPAVHDRLLQLAHATYSQVLPRAHGCLRPQARDVQQVEDAFGELGAKSLEVAETAGADHLGDLVGDGLTNAWDLSQILLFAEHLVELRGEALDGAGPPADRRGPCNRVRPSSPEGPRYFRRLWRSGSCSWPCPALRQLCSLDYPPGTLRVRKGKKFCYLRDTRSTTLRAGSQTPGKGLSPFALPISDC